MDLWMAGNSDSGYRLPDGISFPNYSRRELGSDDLASGGIAFKATRDHMWHWLYSPEPTRAASITISLSDVLSVLDRRHWGWAIDVHLQALRAAFSELESVERVLAHTNDDFEEPTLELLATLFTLYARFQALVEELTASTRRYLT